MFLKGSRWIPKSRPAPDPDFQQIQGKALKIVSTARKVEVGCSCHYDLRKVKDFYKEGLHWEFKEIV